MKTERMCYSYSKLCAAADMVKAIEWKVSRKNEHFSKCAEIEKVFSYCEENINRFLFDTEIHLGEYRNAAYNHKDHGKKELDTMLRRAYVFITRELNDLLNGCRYGEYDCDVDFYE